MVARGGGGFLIAAGVCDLVAVATDVCELMDETTLLDEVNSCDLAGVTAACGLMGGAGEATNLVDGATVCDLVG